MKKYSSKNFSKKIEYSTHSFDRNFDNTVVDTYAFDKALHSEVFNTFLFNQLKNIDKQSRMDLSDIIEQSSSLIIHEVENIYSNTNHRVVDPNVYHDYVSQLVTRIIAN